MVQGSRTATNYLKGMAIAVILVVHYISYYEPAYDSVALGVFASQMVSLFFVLSGMGIYASMNRTAEGSVSIPRDLLGFYYKRFVRIYPLFWAALIVTPLVLPHFQELQQLNLHTVGIFLASPLSRAPGFLWFVPAVIQCYLIAPLLFLIIRKIGATRYLAVCTLATVASMAVTLVILKRYAFLFVYIEPLIYRDLLLENVLLFGFGMAILPLLATYAEQMKLSKTGTGVTFGMFALAIALTNKADYFFPHSQIFAAVFFVVSCFLFCLLTVATARRLPLAGLLERLGRHSYPLYLFHRFFYAILSLAGVIVADRHLSILFTLGLMPLFFLICFGIENGYVRGIRRLSRSFLPTRRESATDAQTAVAENSQSP